MTRNPVKKAFTLIEILVAMGLITVLMGFALANFQGSNKKQKQAAAYSEFVQALHLAKSNATAGKKATTCTDPLLGWRVRFGVNTYTVEGICDTAYPTAPVTTFSSRTETLPAGVTVSVAPASVTEIVFRTLGQGTATNNFPTIVDSTVITIQDGVNINSVTISKRGDINED